MKQTQRHDAIIELVKKQGYVSTEELVEQFAVSPQPSVVTSTTWPIRTVFCAITAARRCRPAR